MGGEKNQDVDKFPSPAIPCNIRRLSENLSGRVLAGYGYYTIVIHHLFHVQVTLRRYQERLWETEPFLQAYFIFRCNQYGIYNLILCPK